MKKFVYILIALFTFAISFSQEKDIKTSIKVDGTITVGDATKGSSGLYLPGVPNGSVYNGNVGGVDINIVKLKEFNYQLHALNQEQTKIIKFYANQSTYDVVGPTGPNPQDFTYNSDGYYYVANRGDHTVTIIHNGVSSLLADVTTSESLSFIVQNDAGVLYAMDLYSATSGKSLIYKIGGEGTVTQLPYIPINNPRDMIKGNDGNIYIVNSGYGNLIRINSSDDSLEEVPGVSNVNRAYSDYYSGKIYTIGYNYAVQVFDIATGTVTPLGTVQGTSGGSQPMGLWINGDFAYISTNFSSSYKLNLVTGESRSWLYFGNSIPMLAYDDGMYASTANPFRLTYQKEQSSSPLSTSTDEDREVNIFSGIKEIGGAIRLPNQTNSIIDTDIEGNTATTKSWVLSKLGGGSVPSLQQVTESGNGTLENLELLEGSAIVVKDNTNAVVGSISSSIGFMQIVMKNGTYNSQIQANSASTGVGDFLLPVGDGTQKVLATMSDIPVIPGTPTLGVVTAAGNVITDTPINFASTSTSSSNIDSGSATFRVTSTGETSYRHNSLSTTNSGFSGANTLTTTRTATGTANFTLGDRAQGTYSIATASDLTALDATLIHKSGTETRSGALTLNSPTIAAGTSSLNAVAPLTIVGGNGGANTNTTGTAVAGNAANIWTTAGTGGNVTSSGTAIAGKGGDVKLLAGDGGRAFGTGTLAPGNGGWATLQAGTSYGGLAGNAEVKAGNNDVVGARGGNVYLTAGWGNFSSTDNPLYNGTIFLGVSGSNYVRGNTVVGNSLDDGIHRFQVTGSTLLDGVVNIKGYTVATLPTGIVGDTAYVTDALAPTYLGTLVGGGSVKCPVFFDGTNWVSH